MPVGRTGREIDAGAGHEDIWIVPSRGAYGCRFLMENKMQKMTNFQRNLLLFAASTFVLFAGSAVAQNYKTLLNQSNTEQLRILRAAVTSSGSSCPNITHHQFNGADRDQAGYWAVSCSNGMNYMVQIANDRGGKMSVTSCAMLKSINVDCWQKF